MIELPGRTRLYSNHRSSGSSGMILTVPGLSRTMFFFPTSFIVFCLFVCLFVCLFFFFFFFFFLECCCEISDYL